VEFAGFLQALPLCRGPAAARAGKHPSPAPHSQIARTLADTVPPGAVPGRPPCPKLPWDGRRKARWDPRCRATTLGASRRCEEC